MAELIPLHKVPEDQVEALLDAAFGEDRHSRTAYLLRIGSKAIAPLSFGLLNGDALIGSIQCWPVRVGGSTLALVGPVAVAPDRQGQRHGHRLMHATLDAAPTIGDPAMVMIGDPEYYGRFGFAADACAGWTLPGPWEPRRLLVRNVGNHSLPQTGQVERADAL
ncbi:MAG: N-acetyltransferase [Sphingomonadales bacterium]|nr:N-acetyltransferase [Sphingomonadales bacterium]